MHSLLKHKIAIIGVVLLLVVAGLTYALLCQKSVETPDHIRVEDVALNAHEKVKVAHASKPEKGLLIYIADKDHAKDDHENAKKFAELSYYVAIVDSQTLLNPTSNSAENKSNQCVNLAQKLVDISTKLQAYFELDTDNLPILVGTEDGSATLYAALAQADKHAFHAAVSINFAPNLKTTAALCGQEKFTTAAADGQMQLAAVKRLPNSFYIFQDENAAPNLVSHAFTDDIGNVRLTIGKGKDQTLAEAIQILQWLDPRLADQISSDVSDSDLPLIEIPVIEQDEKVAKADAAQTMAIIITGDGGWAEIDKNIAKILAEKGIPTVALDSLSYFWKARTVEEATQDVETVIAQYLDKWNKQKVILIGYSFGADVLPFIANNLSAKAQKQVALVALLGMGKTAAFEFRLSSWMDADKNSDRLPLLPEIEKMKWANSICIYGVADEAANCLPTADLGVKIISMSGDHHFDEKYDELVQHIIENAKSN
jgi:type IV secretory pathway VirJ component